MMPGDKKFKTKELSAQMIDDDVLTKFLPATGHEYRIVKLVGRIR